MENNTETEIVEEEVEIIENTMNTEIQDLKKQASENLDKLQRLAAEFDNFRKRTMKEKASMYDDGVRDTLEKLLPVFDNFERAIQTVNDPEEPFAKGVLMIFKLFKDYLDTVGIKEIEALQQKFNTDLHFAVAHVEDENVEANIVVEVLQKGYTYKDKVIRHSMVKVAN